MRSEGLVAGVVAALRGVGVAVRSAEVGGAYVRLALAFVLAIAVIEGAGVWLLWRATPQTADASWWMAVGAWSLWGAGWIAVGVGGPLLALLCVRLLATFLTERIFLAGVEAVAPSAATELRARPGAPWRTVAGYTVIRAGVFLGWSLLAFVITLAPAIGPVLGPVVQIYVTARALSWELMDPYFEKLHYDFDAQRAFMHEHRLTLVGFGLPFVALLAIPLIGPLTIGLAQAAAGVWLGRRSESESAKAGKAREPGDEKSVSVDTKTS